MDRNLRRDFHDLIHPYAQRIARTVMHAAVDLVDDGKKLQLIQLEGLAGEIIDDCFHHQPYGFSSVPLAGAEAIVLFPNGDHGNPLVVAVSDRRHRPRGGAAGEVTMYSHTGARVKMLANGDIEIYPAPGREVLIHHEGGAAGPLATKADLDTVIASFNAHVHASAAPGAPTSVPVTIDEVEPPTIPVTYEPPSLAPIGLSTGTTVLKAQ